MKKVKVLFAGAMLVGAIVATGNGQASAANNDIKIKINNELQVYDQNPLIIDGSTMVPMRGIFEKLGANVTWNKAEQIIDAERGSLNIRLAIGWDGAYIGQEEVKLDTAPQMINGRTLVPLRFVSEALGADVEWNGAAKTVSIIYKTQEDVIAEMKKASSYQLIREQFYKLLNEYEIQKVKPDAAKWNQFNQKWIEENRMILDLLDERDKAEVDGKMESSMHYVYASTLSNYIWGQIGTEMNFIYSLGFDRDTDNIDNQLESFKRYFEEADQALQNGDEMPNPPYWDIVLAKPTN
ncbi:stalk domain-containing protein [Schinkia sp. CFF1]